MRQGLADNYQLTTLSKAQLQLLVSQCYINEAPSAKLEKLIAIGTNIAAIEANQQRLRENIEALSKTPETETLIARYIAKASEQKTRLEEMEKERKTLETEKIKLESELANEIRAFTISE